MLKDFKANVKKHLAPNSHALSDKKQAIHRTGVPAEGMQRRQQREAAQKAARHVACFAHAVSGTVPRKFVREAARGLPDPN